jgi:hypothetical protein
MSRCRTTYAHKPTIEEAEGALKGLNKYVVVQVSVVTEYSRIDWLHAAINCSLALTKTGLHNQLH